MSSIFNSESILNCINEKKYSYIYEILSTASTSGVIDLLKHDPASTQIITSCGKYIRFETNMNEEGSVTKYKELTKIKFTPENKSELEKIRLKKNGVPGAKNSGRLKINFNFGTLYDWFKDGKTRASKNLHIKQKREIKFSLEPLRDQLLQIKQSLISESNQYKAGLDDELASQGYYNTPYPLYQQPISQCNQGFNFWYETDQAIHEFTSFERHSQHIYQHQHQNLGSFQ